MVYGQRVELASYIQGWQERIARDEAARLRREAQLREGARLAAPVLLAAGARRVILFGSVVDGVTTSDSDLDFAVEGLSSEQLEPARQAVAKVLDGKVEFDLVRSEEVGHAVTHAISCGEVLGER